MPASLPFATDFLARHWPLLMECCALEPDLAGIQAMADEVSDAELFLRLVDAHGVAGNLMAVLPGVPDPQRTLPLLESLRRRRRDHVLSSLAKTAELFRTLELFRNASVECVVVKGPVLSLRAYGDSAARQYVDLDFIVRQSDIPRAAEILVAAGYHSRISTEAIRAGKIPGEYHFRRQSMLTIIELHTERTLRYFPLRFPLEKFFQRKASLSLDGHTIPALSAEDEFVLISVHGATHFWERLMWIADVAAIVQRHAELDWAAVRKSAAEVGAGRMVRLALLLAQDLLGAIVPAEMKNEVMEDSVCRGLVRDIKTWLPYAGYATPAIGQRAMFRFRICETAFTGAAYVARLSFATTEEDWLQAGARQGVGIAEALRRPFRLSRKYRRNPSR